jgi:hypothetical protein
VARRHSDRPHRIRCACHCRAPPRKNAEVEPDIAARKGNGCRAAHALRVRSNSVR